LSELEDRQTDDLKIQPEPEVNDNDIHIKAQGGDEIRPNQPMP
jgi:hypothetical protein